ncbi:MAG: hypothetical protein JNJ54_07325 [Myxococcaceae bacterium]|nr:hypothetical protein [Myxococcaceae bacterium]
MTLLAETLTSFAALEEALLGELTRIEKEREFLRRLDTVHLLESTLEGTRFNERLHELLQKAQAALGALCTEAGAEAPNAEALARVAPEPGASVQAAVDAAKLAGGRLQHAQDFNREVTTRALALVRSLEQRLPANGAAYGRHGVALSPGRAVTTSRRA